MAKATTGGKKKVFRKKEKKNIPSGIAYISASFNNTMISITDLEGNLVAQSSSGARGFRGSRKGTPFAAQQASLTAAELSYRRSFRAQPAQGPKNVPRRFADAPSLLERVRLPALPQVQP